MDRFYHSLHPYLVRIYVIPTHKRDTILIILQNEDRYFLVVNTLNGKLVFNLFYILYG